MMKLNFPLEIGLDVDDVCFPNNSLAIAMANEEFELDLKLSDITDWANNGKASVIKKYYHDDALYQKQTENVTEEQLSCVKWLMEQDFINLYFITAVYPDMASRRMMQLMDVFGAKPEQILIGTAKNKVHFDIILDDKIENVIQSPATFPVLMRKPWNSQMTGLLSVNSLSEFIGFVKDVAFSPLKNDRTIAVPSVVALVGPSGSGKNEVASLLAKEEKFARVQGYTTNPDDKTRHTVTEEEFEKMDFFEKTRYGGYAYGIRKKEVKEILEKGISPVIPVDICGANGMKLHFPTVSVYLKKSKCEIVRSIVSDESLSDDEKTLRILSIEAEEKNEAICDYSFRTEDAAEKIRKLLG